MNILVTGANGYIGQRLIPVLLEEGHHLFCTVRSASRFDADLKNPLITVVEKDFLNNENETFKEQLDVAYYLIHSMSAGSNFEEMEAESAHNFLNYISGTGCRQVIFLTGIVNEDKLSTHLKSRLAVENILAAGATPLTALRAGIIVGSGSASFEIIRDLVEKLPVMITPKWLHTLCQPIGIRNVIQFLSAVKLKEKCYNNNYDIGGTDVLSYKDMLLQFAEVRKLKRWIFIVPVMTPKLSSYWLYFVTSTSYSLAVNLVDSMKVNVVCRKNTLAEELGIESLSYKKSVELAFTKIEQKMVLSSWKDAYISSNSSVEINKYIQMPTHGCFKDIKWRTLAENNEQVVENIWSIGGERGWYYANGLWKVRGLIDKLVGGVGLRRGRTNDSEIHAGDALDFWRVLLADKKAKRLLLFAEMKVPGEAWLEFRIMRRQGKMQLRQMATFRPKGLWGRLYWILMLPFHYFIFDGMISNIVKIKN